MTDPQAPSQPEPATLWRDALWCAALLAVDPGLGGAVVRARPGPALDAWLEVYASYTGYTPQRLPPGIGDERLFGGIDLARTLSTGKTVRDAGLLHAARGGTVLLPMAERVEAGLAGRLALALDQGGLAMLAIDEGAEPDEKAPACLRDRLAFCPDLSDIPLAASLERLDLDQGAILAARAALPDILCPDALSEAVVGVAAGFGISSMRAPLLATRAARALAALLDADEVDEVAMTQAARLVLAPRATRIPDLSPPEEEAPPPPDTPPEPPEDMPESDSTEPSSASEAAERLLEATAASLPPGLIAALMAPPRRSASAGSAGGDWKGGRRGRPAGSRPGAPGRGARLDVVTTLRVAAPWQPVRRRLPHAPGNRVLVRPDDFRIRRYKSRAERVLVFVVDASGSAAAARLAETKGAIELMLGEAYVRREQVALIAFRRDHAELLLPPTRSLVQTKRRLAGLPGGGATPLAAGLVEALTLARQIRGRGMDVAHILLTDGRANMGLDGQPGREAATEDARRTARALRADGDPVLLIDTGQRQQPDAAALAKEAGARYLPLPRADAGALTSAVRGALG